MFVLNSKQSLSVFVVSLLWMYNGGLVMASSENESESSSIKDLDQTPTWAVASVCTVFILISIILEKSLHKIGTWLRERHKKPLLEALEKIKSELMILGFISLLLTFGQTYIVKICIPQNVAHKFLPCPYNSTQHGNHDEKEHHRKLLFYEHRYLTEEDDSHFQCKEGKEPLISAEGLHQLHILIFFLAFLHVLYSAVTMLLGRLKIRAWKAWEAETLSLGYEFTNDPSRFRLTHETSFVRHHFTLWTKNPIFFYISCFFRQFYRSVDKPDYLTLRNGFIAVHLSPGSKFNFQKYIKRSLEDDFKVVVGVSPVLWASFVFYLLLNVNGWHAIVWASLIPVVMILIVGTKLQATLSEMAIEITEKHAVIQGIPLVQGSDKYFWFGRPQLVLHLIHFALFQNAFQITYILWIWYSFGRVNCFHADKSIAIVKLALGVGVLCLCSYMTLPLYALVTQMGSRMKKSIFDEQTSRALKKWHNAVKKKHGLKLGKSGVRTMDGSTSTIHSTTTSPTLHRYNTTDQSTRSVSAYDDDQDLYPSDIELSPTSSTSNLFAVRVDSVDQDAKENEHQTAVEIIEQQPTTRGSSSFSFVRSDHPKRSAN
ncbi:MLO-like protein 10 [Vicia villosa]|uniref:MLO-like protein 10 n=1 Tax=Vicia villosa TaxID=3911 RepID=UPI00273C92F2|nr:MLO-like protein 10 [Vicia villosa]